MKFGAVAKTTAFGLLGQNYRDHRNFHYHHYLQIRHRLHHRHLHCHGVFDCDLNAAIDFEVKPLRLRALALSGARPAPFFSTKLDSLGAQGLRQILVVSL